MWLVRDFTLKLVDENGFPLEPRQYLEHALEIQKGVSDSVESKNKIIKGIIPKIVNLKNPEIEENGFKYAK